MIHIYIPSLKRFDNVLTWNALPESVRSTTWMVCPASEVSEHVKRGRQALACDLEGIGPTRQWILERAAKLGIKKIMMLDDDMRHVQARREDGKITNCSAEEALLALDWVEDMLETHAHGGWGVRFLAWNAPLDKLEMSPGRMMYSLAYNVPMVMKAKGTFRLGVEPWLCMEDFHMTLQLLKAGHPNVVSLDWRVNMGSSNARGGCSSWRTLERQNESAKRLAALHPGVVKVTEKPAWKGMGAPMRLDVQVQWKNALRGAK